MSKCQNVSNFLAHVYVCVYAHVCAYACKNVFSIDIFNILQVLALNTLICKHLTDLQKFVTACCNFCKSIFCKSVKILFLWRSIVSNKQIFKLLHAWYDKNLVVEPFFPHNLLRTDVCLVIPLKLHHDKLSAWWEQRGIWDTLAAVRHILPNYPPALACNPLALAFYLVFLACHNINSALASSLIPKNWCKHFRLI